MKYSRMFRGLICSVMVGVCAPLLTPLSAQADTNPSNDTPATVSNDVLPTVQIGDPGNPESNGSPIGWAQVVVGNTVYVTGNFTTARPAGAAPGTNQVSRKNLLAYNITTGELDTSFNVPLNDVGKAIAASPDGKRLYVGGKFTTAGGSGHARIVAIDLTTKTVVGSFTDGLNGTVNALAATNDKVYAGGSFSSTTSGSSRQNLAAFSSTGTLLGWTASPDRQVQSLVISPTKPYIVFGGPFSSVNGQPYHSIGAVDATTGAPVPWASQSASYGIRNEDANSGMGILSMAANGSKIFLGGYNFVSGTMPAGLEGRAAIDPNNGNILWVNNCYGDTYGVFPIGDVLYSVGHPHDCSAIGSFPQTPASWVWQRAVAERTDATCTNVNSSTTPWRTSYAGTPCTTQLDWYPDLTAGNYVGQAAWSVSGNASYVTLAGEFPTVNGVAQQGLVRFGVKSVAPNKSGPKAFPANSMFATTADANGNAAIRLPETYDPDNAVLTYSLYRDNGTDPITTFSADTRSWNLSSRSYMDNGLTPNTSHSYKLVARDPFSNSVTTTATPPSRFTPLVPYRLADTRDGSGQPNAGSHIPAGGAIRVKVTGLGGVPSSGVTAAVLNVTVANTNGDGYIAVYPSGRKLPNSSTLNMSAGKISNNQTTVALTGSSVDVYLGGAASTVADVIIDVVGYYSTNGSGFIPTAPTRITDTRADTGMPNAGNSMSAGKTLKIQATGVGGIPTTATSVVANVTTVGLTNTGGYSYLTLFPAGSSLPNSSSMNFNSATLTKEVTVKLGSDGAFNIYNDAGTTNVIVDIVGYYVSSGGSGFVPVPTTRITDTRSGTGMPNAGSHLGDNASLTIAVVGSAAQVPAGAKAVVTNLTEISTTTGAYLVAYPAGVAEPYATNLTFVPPVAFNETTVKLGSNNSFTITNHGGTADIIVDALGFFY